MAPTSNKKGAKPSKVVKPSIKKRRSTVTTRHHRYQTFSERIAKLKIDPIRRRRQAEGLEEHTEETATYFGRSLSEWRDLNLSNTFVAFAKDVAPYCDSLPMVLHNQDGIMDLLVTYVEKADGLAMEPLLNLMSHFAHDLDTRFEQHFERAVSTIAAVAAKHQDPAVVEWSFTCLAWLFKYLSRLLSPDLRPLYDLMSSYLGKQSQKPFIIRFAAESLSFLLRKAAATYERDSEPLDHIVQHMVQDCVGGRDERSSDLHRQGVMTLLTEAVKGVQLGIHSSGVSTLKSLLKACGATTADGMDVSIGILTGVLTSLIHHTTSESFRPLLDAILSYIDGATGVDAEATQLASSVMYTIASVRKGTRVADWKPLVSTIKVLFERADQLHPLDSATASSLLSTLAVTFQTATIDAILPALQLLESIRKAQWSPHFLRFCDLFARLGNEKFQTFVLPQLQKFVVEQWQQYGDELYRLVPQIASRGVHIKLQVPVSMQDALVRLIDSTNVASESSVDRSALTDLAMDAMPYMTLSQERQKSLAASLRRAVVAGLDSDAGMTPGQQAVALGTCFGRLLDLSDDREMLVDLWSGICSSAPQVYTLTSFWENVNRYLSLCKPADWDAQQICSLEAALVKTLCLSDHDARQHGLEVMAKLYELKSSPPPEVLSTAISIESTPISLESSRAISMNIRRLASSYTNSSSDKLMQKAIPTYCFGLLHLQLSQAWEDAISALVEMCKIDVAEETVIALAQTWLEGIPSTGDDGQQAQLLTVDTAGFRVMSDFECSNLAKLSAISKQVFEEPDSGYPSAEQRFQIACKRNPTITPTSRGQALRILGKAPQLAEKRSRMLVPVLLRWAGAGIEEAEEGTAGGRWSRKDQKSMLAVFAQFNNPKVLYKSAEAHAALLNLCANGDAEIQRSALKAIFAWKDPAVNRYEEHLLNMLDEARFREEVSVFLQDGDENEVIRPEDHPRLMPVLLRLLYGRAVAGGQHGQGSRRKAIFVALSRFGQDPMGMFVDIAMSSVCGAANTTEPHAPLRQQIGMLNMLNDLLETLGSEIEPFAAKMLHAVLLCTVAASKRLDIGAAEDASLLRSVRQAGIQCTVQLFAEMKDLDFSAQAEYIRAELIVPRLSNFATENMQSVSGMLRLFSAWTASSKTASLLGDLLPQIAQLLREPGAKDEVRLFVLQDIVDKLLQDTDTKDVLEQHITPLVQSTGYVLASGPSKDVLDACVRTLTQLATHITDPVQALDILRVCSELLTKPGQVVSPGTKTGLLRTMLPLLDAVDPIKAGNTLFEAVSGLFSRLANPDSRTILCSVLSKICSRSPDLSQSATICADLNAQGGRLDEPDHERRENGFGGIAEHGQRLTPQQWLPIVHNCLFYIRDVDDLVSRSSAAQALEHLIEAAEKHSASFIPLIRQTLLPGLERGMQAPSELVRAEYVRLLGHLVVKLPDWQMVNDMRPLTVDGDDEASVFTNILHIQQHRRLRALRRLAEEGSNVSSSNVTRFFLPLLEHFVFDQVEGDAGRTLADQTVSTIGALAGSLNWSSFRATFKRYVSYIDSKEDLEKTVLRLLGAVVEALAAKPNVRDGDAESKGTMSKSQVVERDFLPPLMKYLHRKDESTVDRRMPVAVTIVKLMLVLPESELAARLPPVLTDVSHVLRSRSQEARDQTRKTLAAILALVGPQYLGFMLKELRTALQRGYQLHVLSYTVHSLLVNATEVSGPGDLDHCLTELVAIIMDDVFGISGQEKDAEEYKSGMKEVKSSKSFDTMELLAKVTPVRKLGLLLQPLRALLSEKLDSKGVTKVNELLTRLRKGVDQNQASDSRDMLVFCHEIVRQVHAEQSALSTKGAVLDYKVRKYLIQMESANKSKGKGATTSQIYKLVSFALNLVRKIVRRHDDLLTPSNIAGFLPMTGDALVQGQEEVKLSAVRLLATIIKVPLAELDKNAPVYIKETVALIKGAPNMTSDSAKAGLELLTAVLRERRTVSVREADIAHVVKALKTDIDEPDRQGVIYKFLRAVLGRKIVITEVYEIMDEVGRVTVINADRNVRESARSAYLQFVLDYPQGKDRWNKQAAFFVENLRYEHSAGRQSVMELLHQLLTKLSDDVLAQLAFTFFVALVPVQISDQDQACRQMAGILITKLFDRADSEQLKSFLALMDKWLANEKKPMIQVAALECWKTYLRAKSVPSKQRDQLRDNLADFFTSEDVVVGPQLLQAMLDTFSVMVEVASDTAFAESSAPIWDSIQECLTASSEDVKETAGKLIGLYFSHLASSSAKTEQGLSSLPIKGSEGLELDVDGMRQICRTSLQALMTSTGATSDSITAQTVRNIVFLGRCFAANNMPWREGEDVNDDEGEGEFHEEEDVKVQKRGSPALAYLLNRLSYIIRQDKMPVVARIAALQCQAALINQLRELPGLQSLLRPLYSLTDPSIPQPQTDAHRGLVDKARELMELIQKKVGTETYVRVLGQVRKDARAKRDERRQKRKIEAVSAPERWARDKKRKHEAMKVKRKEKGAEMRGMRRGW